MFVELELPPRPPMTDAGYIDAVQRAAHVLREAEPWLLLPLVPGEYRVARRRTTAMRFVVAGLNVVRRVVRWWRGRVQLARERRFFMTGNRNGG